MAMTLDDFIVMALADVLAERAAMRDQDKPVSAPACVQRHICGAEGLHAGCSACEIIRDQEWGE